MTRVNDWEDVARIFDERGNVRITKTGCKPKKYRKYRGRIYFYSSDIKLLEELKEFIGIGTVRQWKSKNWTNREYAINGSEDVNRILNILLDLVNKKKSYILEQLNKLDSLRK